MSSKPLAGLRVVELARILAGPWAGQTLADLGAEVIKVEAPEGDDTRRWGPPFIDRDGTPVAAYFHAANRGKRSVVADFRTPEGQAKVRALLADADILIENFKLGGLAKYGLDYPTLKQDFPGLIYCSITGFGQDGPYAHRAGYDYIIQGMSGLMSITGPAEGEPHRVGVAVTDLFTGVYAATAILAAVVERARTGTGAHLDLALLDCAVSVMANQAMNYLSTGTPPGRTGNWHPNLGPYQVFECADGHIIIATGNDGQYQRLCHLLGLPGLIDDPAYRTNADRVANRAALSDALSAATRRWTKADLLRGCEDQGVPAGPINTLDEVFADPQVQARGMALDLGPHPGVRSPFVIDGERCASDLPAPALGEGDRNG
ncbi:MAG: CoA transferase [Rhodobacter sp.]|uniref:CaiB/BaiF CoA transferase family protein n=1 Tax=Pararhodobacter sp. TaxID=2127056 RepID=UPI001D84B252|nr:CaiB/BaiF CoA-transferase family protein [Pararhodobacter sp.]MCB1346344.1 CoA transferase [Paracoccaceae bacterium]MCC0072444.1 CoA transferase [Rhodobacter sp.]HPD91274.1 CaiB/BaiF CoA-transferase family protein [Pararhodobacter sp.]